MTQKSVRPTPHELRTRIVPLLVIAPAGALLLTVVLYLVLRPRLGEHVSIHVGPDGVGFGSLPITMAILCAIIAVLLGVGSATAWGFLKAGHWFQTEKSIAVSIMSVGYGVVGVAIAMMLSLLGGGTEELSGDAVGYGALGFVIGFAAACWNHAVLFPRAALESLDRG